MIRKLAFLMSCSAAALPLLLSGGCQFGSPTQGGGTEGEGITGTLVDPSGIPLSGAWVRPFAVTDAAAKAGLSKETATADDGDSARTDSRGTYRFTSLPPGTYNFAATLRRGDTIYAALIRNVPVTENANLGTDTLRATGAAVIAVTVNAVPVAGAACAVAASPWKGTSGTDGLCTITGLPPGVHEIRVQVPGLDTTRTVDVTVASNQWTGAPPAPFTGDLIAPRLVTPAPGETISPDSVLLAWSPVPGAIAYDLHVSPGIEFVTSGLTNVAGIAHTISSLIPDSTYVWRVRARGPDTLGPWSEVRMFRVLSATPNPLLPGASTPLYPVVSPDSMLPESPTFSWSAVAGATGYHLEVVGGSFQAVDLVNDSTLTATSRVVGPIAYNTPYYWRVRARNANGWGPWSATVSITRDNTPGGTPPPAPAPLSPVRDSVVFTATVNLVWNKVESATAYVLELATDTNFIASLRDTIVPQSVAAIPSVHVAVGPLEYGTTYYWRVRGRNAFGDGPYSAPQKFSVSAPVPQADVPPVPIPQSPEDLATNVPASATLSWWNELPAVSPAGTRYRLQVAQDTAFVAPVVNDTLAPTVLQTGALARTVSLQANTRYFWRVRAERDEGNSAYFAPRSFQTAAP